MKNHKPIKILLSVWSPFYSPVFLTKDFLEKEGQAVHYSERLKREDRLELIHENKVNIVAAAVSLHWESKNIGKRNGIYHFAQINCRDGFFLVGRKPREEFCWKDLASSRLLVHPGRQPIIALKYAVKMNGVVWKDIDTPESNNLKKMLHAFHECKGDFIHLQGYWAQQLVAKDGNLHIVAEVGGNESKVPEYSFSSLMASEKFITSPKCELFLKAYKKALHYAATADPQKIADKLKCFFFPMAKETPVVLSNCIEQYQKLGCWQHDGQISKEHYEKVKEIFLKIKEVSGMHYNEVVRQPA